MANPELLWARWCWTQAEWKEVVLFGVRALPSQQTVQVFCPNKGDREFRVWITEMNLITKPFQVNKNQYNRD